MDTDGLERMLDGQSETQRLEFKDATEWSVKLFAKDILALANFSDGGDIIVGVEDQSFKRVGITTQQRQTFKIDIMLDQMTSYADPHVYFSVTFPKDKGDRTYAVIHVKQFEEIPVICRKNDQSAGTCSGVVYNRNSNRRVESAPVSNSYDMRNIVELATVRMMSRRVSQGYKVNEDDVKKLEKELGGL